MKGGPYRFDGWAVIHEYLERCPIFPSKEKAEAFVEDNGLGGGALIFKVVDIKVVPA